jgi:hypothetical protein
MSYYNNAGFGDIIGIPSLAVNGFLWETMKEINPNLGIAYGETMPFYPIGDSAAADEPWDNKPYFIYDRVFRFSSKPFYEHKRESTLYYLKAREVDSLEWSAVLQAILDREDDTAIDINNWITNQWYKKIKKELDEDEVNLSSFSVINQKSIIKAYQSGICYSCKPNEESNYFNSNSILINPRELKIENDYPFYFHNVRVYQSRSSSPSSAGKLREVSTVQPYYISEFMIDTHFHYTKQILRRKKQGGEAFDFEYKYDKYEPTPNFSDPDRYS